ncbi:hypothetical protein H6G33_10610 [Calothrix sp. FACHB-1219]|uniref:hypothetical protein n=1 Tax=unclassified Calothrix TaxID=2619626 RepID=UPI00168A0E70|nr:MULTISPECIES: hypothetical protein [unclassified Calothrix]MBD2201799.1 hypothetical protein [Calothrix sp. FACHB-168]MBD2217485.1 hypothetical protein [Calothrix sp. FACHB-1219]
MKYSPILSFKAKAGKHKRKHKEDKIMPGIITLDMAYPEDTNYDLLQTYPNVDNYYALFKINGNYYAQKFTLFALFKSIYQNVDDGLFILPVTSKLMSLMQDVGSVIDLTDYFVIYVGYAHVDALSNLAEGATITIVDDVQQSALISTQEAEDFLDLFINKLPEPTP